MVLTFVARCHGRRALRRRVAIANRRFAHAQYCPAIRQRQHQIGIALGPIGHPFGVQIDAAAVNGVHINDACIRADVHVDNATRVLVDFSGD